MSKSFYLRAVERGLREAVLPVTHDPFAKDTLASCLSVLAGLRNGLDGRVAEDAAGFDPAKLPAGLYRAFCETEAVAPPEGLSDDLAVRSVTRTRISAGQRWLETEFNASPEHLATLGSLLAWERAQRAEGLAMQAAASRAGAPPAGTDVQDLERGPLQAYLTARFGRAARITSFRRLMGGRSRQTALFSVEGVESLPVELVVQRDPPVDTGSQGVAVQAPVIEAAQAAGVHAPRVFLVEHAREPLGAAFMITERLPGQPVIDGTTEYFSPPPPGLQSLAVNVAREMAKLHAMPIGKLDMTLAPTFDPATSNWVDEVASLRARLKRLSRGPSMVVAAGMAWLERNAASIGSIWCVVHTDMLLHNLLREGDEVSAVLDWEIAHIGHPGEDLGYVRPVIEQILPWSDFMDAYGAAGGTHMNKDEVDFFSLYAGLRLLTLVQNPSVMFENGLTNDLRLAETSASFVPRLIDRIDGVLQSVLAG